MKTILIRMCLANSSAVGNSRLINLPCCLFGHESTRPNATWTSDKKYGTSGLPLLLIFRNQWYFSSESQV
jgi:hypothetical protein